MEDVSPLPEYTEELQLGYIKQEQYFLAAQQAVLQLRWQIASVSDNVIMCHTPGGNHSLGESINIRVEKDIAVFRSRSANEYYSAEQQNIQNAALFKQTVADVIERNEKAERNLSPMNREKLGALVPSKSYLITPVLIYINILVFIVMVLSGVAPLNPDAQTLLHWGGNFRPSTTSGEWWRLFTYMFLHGGLLHLLMNMYAMLYIGMFLEPLLGKLRFAAAYVLTGLCAGLMSITIHSYTVGVGASGAIFGLYGVFLAMLTTKHMEKTVRNTTLRSILFFVVFNLLYGMQGNIDNAAHIGGLLSGVIIGYLYYPGIAKHKGVAHQAGVSILIAMVIAASAVIILPRLTNDMALYDQKMKKFVELESMALEVYTMNKNAPKEDILYNLKDRGIYYWNENIKILHELQALDLPPHLREKNTKLLQYCKLRIEVYDLLYKQIKEENNSYMNIINEDNNKILKIIEAVKAS